MDAAMRKMQAIEEINERLPHLDCGSCGSPTCHAFAEDIVNGEANENEKNDFNGFLIEPSILGIKNVIEKIKNLKNPETIMNNALDTALSMERIKMSENYINIIQNILV